MSLQTGNTKRTRPQKHQNVRAFINNLHDKTPQLKVINSIEVAGVCEQCKNVIEWKIKYNKFKPLKAPRKCIKCDEKTVKHAYHKICSNCATRLKMCPKCTEEKEVVKSATCTSQEQQKYDAEMEKLIKSLPERKRRTFLRYLARLKSQESKQVAGEETNIPTTEELIAKLQVLKLSCKKKGKKKFEDDDDDDDSDFNFDSDFDSDCSS